MPQIEAFKGTCYNSAIIDDMAKVIAPPYDVITGPAKARLLSNSPYNIIRLILGKAAQEMGGVRAQSEFEEAAATFAQWLAAEVLVRDSQPALYDLEEEFEAVGKRYCRRGFIGLLKLEEEKNAVRPHEKTMQAPKQDRLELTRHCRANFSQIFTLYEDEDNAVEKALQITRPAAPMFTFSEDGITRRLWRITDPQAIAAAQAHLQNREIFIADGHHRYETALLYQQEMRRKTPASPGNQPWDYVMSYFSSMSSPGLAILPTHRLLSNFPTPSADELKRGLEQYFTLEKCDDDGEPVAALLQKLEKSGDNSSFIMLAENFNEPLLLTLKRTAAAEILGQLPQSLAALDVSVLQQLVFGHILGISSADMEQQRYTRYTQDAANAIAAVRSGEAQIAILLKATKIEQVRDVAQQGEKMPQKSTFFFPKLATGLVLNRLD
ncbi:MAG: DUF1015 domain-containing protein [Deltaproteobacteria bacterium]|nr:DUF1015 domain-containing protein [Deltaproteobacteria bacterium]